VGPARFFEGDYSHRQSLWWAFGDYDDRYVEVRGSARSEKVLVLKRDEDVTLSLVVEGDSDVAQQVLSFMSSLSGNPNGLGAGVVGDLIRELRSRTVAVFDEGFVEEVAAAVGRGAKPGGAPEERTVAREEDVHPVQQMIQAIIDNH